MTITRAQLAAAIDHWGRHGDGGIPGLRLTRQASQLVTVLALMDFHDQPTAALPAGSDLARLAEVALTPSP